MIRLASEDDLRDIDKISSFYPKDLGQVMFSHLRGGISLNELYVYELDNRVVGFILFHKRLKDKVSVIYDIAVHRDYLKREIVTSLFNILEKPIFLKCKETSQSNLFYQKLGMILKEVETNKNNVRLNHWELK